MASETSPQFPQFLELPLEIQERILTVRESSFRLVPFLYKPIPESFRRLIYQVNCTKTEFKTFLTEEKPLKFSACVAPNKSFLFNLVNSDGTNSYWECTMVGCFEKETHPLRPPHKIRYEYKVCHLTKRNLTVTNENYINTSREKTLFTVDDILEVLFARRKWREFDLLTTFKIRKMRTNCPNMQMYLLKQYMNGVHKFISKLQDRTKTFPHSHIEMYTVYIHFAWNFNIGHLIDFESVYDVYAKPSTIEHFKQLNDTISKKIPDFMKMIPLLAD